MLEIGKEIEKAAEEIKKRKAKLVGIQAPEGLKSKLLEIAERIEKETGAKTVTFANPIFGACMLADDTAKKLGVELLLHFGHSQFFRNESVPTIYLPVRYALPVETKQKAFRAVKEKLGKEKIKKVGLTATIQFAFYLPELKEMLEKEKITAEIGKGTNISAGQILGCNYSVPVSIAQKVEAILFLGDGMFHPLGIAFATDKRVFTCNPFEGTVTEITGEKKKFLKKRMAIISAGLQAKKFGFLVSTEKGQFGFNRAIQLKEKLAEQGKQAIIVASDLIKPDYVLGIDVDAWVNTACPRIATDDSMLFSKPVLTISELKIVLGEKKIEDYSVEEIVW